MSGIIEIKNKLNAFRKRYYIRQILIGLLLFLIISLSFFLLLNSLEYQLWMGRVTRGILFFSSLSSFVFLFFWLVFIPVSKLLKLRKGISDERAAEEIAKSFPEIQDRLLNTLQLSDLSSSCNQLLEAAIDKKATELSNISFLHAVDFRVGRKYGLILGVVIFGFALVSFINPAIISDSANRLVNYNEEFIKRAPFSFIVHSELSAYRGEDYLLSLAIEGNAVPEKVILVTEDGAHSRLRRISTTTYEYIFPKIQRSQSFRFEAAGHFSKWHHLAVHERPDLIAMSIFVMNPIHTGGERKIISNSGDITILEGSSVEWKISTLATDSIQFKYNDIRAEITTVRKNNFASRQRIFKSGNYQITLFNQSGHNQSDLNHHIDVIKDERPEISARHFPDSSLFRFIVVIGNIRDDHGFSSLQLNYKRDDDGEFSRIPLQLNENLKTQSFFANWEIDSLNLDAGSRLEFFISVSDNDAINGSKTSRSKTYLVEIPAEKEINEIIDKKSEVVEKEIDKSKEDMKRLNERLKKIEERLKAEQKFDWKEKKLLNDIIGDREKLADQIEKLKKKHEELQRTNDQFTRRSEQIKNKDEKLHTMLEELLDEETRKLYEQLKELLKENSSSEQIRQQLQQIQKNDKNLERELERVLELFKRLKMESALEQILQKLDTLAQEQEYLSEENKIKWEDEPNQVQKEQENIQKEFEDLREKMNEIEQMNQELKNPEPVQDFELEKKQIAKDLREINEKLKKQENEREGGDQKEEDQQQKRSQIRQQQKRAGQRMKKLSQKMSEMQSGRQMVMMQVNLDQLRDILDNLVKLSFNQEDLMKSLRQISQSDPRFLELSQGQLKLRDDAKVIQDSLLALASRVIQISSFITREVGSINDNIDESLSFLKDRNRGRAIASQQFAMTAINNLALLLDDIMQQMQMAMSEAMGNPNQSQQKQNLPNLQQMQNQLGKKIDELKESGKNGRQLSEELARLAAEQELIRRQLELLKQAQDGKPGGGAGGDDLQKAIDQMEQNEIDLVNKKLTQQLINRQKDIITRMLEAKKAQREQESEEERKAESPSIISKEFPPEFEEYLKLKQKEIELLKTIPIELNPFYKKEVNDYFRRISSDDRND